MSVKKKPFSVTSQEEGRGPKHVTKFSTLEDAAKYIKDYWQGPDYMDGTDSFHTDYSTYTLGGFTFMDIGNVTYAEWGREFQFNAFTS